VSYLDKKSCRQNFWIVIAESDVKLGRIWDVSEVNVFEGVREVLRAVYGKVYVGVVLVSFEVIQEVPEPRLRHARIDVGRVF
jgi:hypothetical protein